MKQVEPYLIKLYWEKWRKLSVSVHEFKGNKKNFFFINNVLFNNFFFYRDQITWEGPWQGNSAPWDWSLAGNVLGGKQIISKRVYLK